MFGWLRDRRRREIESAPVPESVLDTLHTNVAYFALLDDEERRRLAGQVQVFLAEKNFEGCGGLVLDARMPVVVAAYACLMQLNLDLGYYPHLQSILLYPDMFEVEDDRPDDAGVVSEERDARLGESWDIGAIVLSWADVEHDARTLDGHNVVLHEFAHQIDRADGAHDGWPEHIDPGLQDRWYEVMRREFNALAEAAETGRPTVIDPYGANDPAEFFAVLTEHYFTDPVNLNQHHPDLYCLYRDFYRQNTRERFVC